MFDKGFTHTNRDLEMTVRVLRDLGLGEAAAEVESLVENALPRRHAARAAYLALDGASERILTDFEWRLSPQGEGAWWDLHDRLEEIRDEVKGLLAQEGVDV